MQKPAMVPWRRALRIRPRTIAVAAVFALAFWYLASGVLLTPTRLSTQEIARQYPLVWEHIGTSNKTGGAWYIPPHWIPAGEEPKTIVEAAELASRASLAKTERQLPYSKIPLIVHQTYKSTDVQSWNPQVIPFVEKWLRSAVSPQGDQPMAYFMWDDAGIDELLHVLEKDFEHNMKLFSRIEQTDIFRIIACKWFGGIYADMDTEPLRVPQQWITLQDLSFWTDNVTSQRHGMDTKDKTLTASPPAQPVSLIGGLEADLPADTDKYWRMGYSFPVQLTQWALASSPKHPALEVFMATLRQLADNAREDARQAGVNLTALEKAYAVERTGPVAFTKAVMSYLDSKIGFRWNSLSGREDDGKVKLVTDVLILPITGFSPGRQRIMGSKPITDVEARLNHHFFGSWRHFNVATESGKLCRTLFGLCRDWSMADA